MSRDDGGSAFPAEEKIEYPSTSVIEYHQDMSLRDYFAAKALAGQIQFEGMEGSTPDHISAMAYELADAMLKARKS
jgi:hypothetical protein